jgi:dipeptidyl aminopeptidase/acylaminoacyl peptidase
MTLLRLLLLSAMLGASLLRAADPIPLAAFFKEATFDEIKLSPDGTKVAALSTYKDHLNLYVIDLKTKTPTMLTGLTEMSVGGVLWVGNKRLLFTGIKDGSLNGGLFAIDADGKNSRALGHSVDQQVAEGANVARLTEFLSFYGNSTDEILVTSNERRESEPDVYRMNVHTGKKAIVAMNPGKIGVWVADNTGAVRLGYGQQGRSRFWVYRDGAKGEFREVKRWDFTEGDFAPLAFDETNSAVLVRDSLGANTAGISLVDVKTLQVTKQVFRDETYDADRVLRDRRSGALLGISLTREKPAIEWTLPSLKKLQAMVDAELPDTLNTFYSRNEDNSLFVIDASSDRDRGTFYLFNAREMTLEKLVSRADWLKPAQMSVMKPITYPARDGMTIHGYVTIPAGSSGKDLPLVVNPHGGPWVRDEWRFNPEVQFLASRGYAVLQMNFRGSTGYGHKLEEAGYGEWGRAMQDDITDGVKWAIAQGIADPNRVAIYGASYGGYAAMAGLAFTPDLYRCGINYVGVTDIQLLLKTLPDGWEVVRAELEAKTGNAKTKGSQLEEVSPLQHIDQVRVPVFFAYGRLDERVDMRHGKNAAAALRKRGIPVVWMERDNEGHGYRRKENKLAFYGEMEKFLATYLGPKTKVELGELKTTELPAVENK